VVGGKKFNRTEEVILRILEKMFVFFQKAKNLLMDEQDKSILQLENW
jgi:hypothetical protein